MSAPPPSGFDETISLLLVEHLNFARRHASLLGFKIAGDFRADPALFCNRRSRPKDARAKGKKGRVTRLARAGVGVVVSLVAHRLNDAVDEGDRRVFNKKLTRDAVAVRR